MELLDAFLRSDSGTAKIEYALIASIVSVAAVAAFQAMGDSLIVLFSQVATTIEAGN